MIKYSLWQLSFNIVGLYIQWSFFHVTEASLYVVAMRPSRICKIMHSWPDSHPYSGKYTPYSRDEHVINTWHLLQAFTIKCADDALAFLAKDGSQDRFESYLKTWMKKIQVR